MEHDFQRVVEQYATTLYRLAFSYCGNRPDAEDVLQEVFLKYLCCGLSFEAEEKRRSWLMTVTANQCRDLLRSAWRRRRQSLSDLPELPAPEPEDYSDVEAALAALAPKYRGIVFLFYYEGYSTKQIAQALGLNESTVRTRLERARKHLKHHLGGTEHEA